MSVTDMLKTIPVEDFQRWKQKREQNSPLVCMSKGTILKGIILMFEKNKNFGKLKYHKHSLTCLVL